MTLRSEPVMRFGLPGGRGELDATSPESKIVQARTADELGYDCLWFSEEHFSAAGTAAAWVPSSPIVQAAAVAASTSRVRLGFSALSLRLHNPVRLAEDIATLDVLSGGRVNLGISWAGGEYAEAFGGCGGTDQTLQHRLDAMIGYWTGRRIEIEGADFQLTPVPRQDPHPPIYLTGHTDETIIWAAQRGYALIQPAIQSPASLRHCLRLFSAHGGEVTRSPVERFCFVAESDALAREQAWPLVVELAQRLRRNAAGAATHPLTSDDDLEPERFYQETAIVGGPETVTRRIAALRAEHGVHYVNLRPSLSGLCPLSLQRITVALFAAEVIPALVALPDRRGLHE
ncbi:MAG: LLM class flavin-dependent oxidoreductase [Pseudonocardiaceae bacterium]